MPADNKAERRKEWDFIGVRVAAHGETARSELRVSFQEGPEGKMFFCWEVR
jgi:hypothetical protein